MTIAVPNGVIGESLARGLCNQSFRDALVTLQRKASECIKPHKQSRTAIFNSKIRAVRRAFADVLITEEHIDNGKKSTHNFILMMPGDEFIGMYRFRLCAHRSHDEHDFLMVRSVISMHAYARYVQSHHDASTRKFGRLMWPHVRDMSEDYHIDEVVTYTIHDSGVCVWEPHRERDYMWIMKTFVAADAIDGHGKIGAAWRKYKESKKC